MYICSMHTIKMHDEVVICTFWNVDRFNETKRQQGIEVRDEIIEIVMFAKYHDEITQLIARAHSSQSIIIYMQIYQTKISE